MSRPHFRAYSLLAIHLVAIAACTEPGPRRQFSWTFCGTPSDPTPAFFAVQDGNRAWRRIAPSGATFDFSLGADRGALSWVTAQPDSIIWTTVYATADEFAARPSGCAVSGEARPGTITGAPSSLVAVRHGGGPEALITVGSSGDASFNLTGPAIAADLIAARFGVSAILLRDHPANGSLTLAFGGPDAFALVSDAVAIQNGSPACNPIPIGAGEEATVTSSITTASSVARLIVSPILAGQALVSRVPAARLLASDLHQFTASEVRHCLPTTEDVTTTRTVTAFSNDVPGTFVFGPQPTPPTSTSLSTSSFVRQEVVIPVQPEYDAQWSARVSSGQPAAAGAAARVQIVTMSAGFAGQVTSARLTPPDLSTLPGWSNSWALQAADVAVLRVVSTVSDSPHLWPGALRAASIGAGARFASAMVNRRSTSLTLPSGIGF